MVWWTSLGGVDWLLLPSGSLTNLKLNMCHSTHQIAFKCTTSNKIEDFKPSRPKQFSYYTTRPLLHKQLQSGSKTCYLDSIIVKNAPQKLKKCLADDDQLVFFVLGGEVFLATRVIICVIESRTTEIMICCGSFLYYHKTIHQQIRWSINIWRSVIYFGLQFSTWVCYKANFVLTTTQYKSISALKYEIWCYFFHT